MESKHFSLEEVCQTLNLDASLVRLWSERELIRPSQEANQEFFVDEDLERMRVIRNLLDDLDVNLEGVEVILSMRDRMISMEKWMRDVFQILDEHHLLTDDLMSEFKKFSPQ